MLAIPCELTDYRVFADDGDHRLEGDPVTGKKSATTCLTDLRQADQPLARSLSLSRVGLYAVVGLDKA